MRERSTTHDERIDGWLGVLEGEGIAAERAQVHAALDAAWQRFQRGWETGVVSGAPEAVDHALDHLGLAAAEPGLRAELLRLMTEPPPARYPSPTDGIGECLEALRSAGLGIGIICDVGLTPSSTLRRYLDAHGLLGYFSHWSFSDEVGVFKPDPTIFAHARLGLSDALGAPLAPDDLAHVGDLRRTDVAGAQGAGWLAVRYRGAFDDPGVAGGGDGVPAASEGSAVALVEGDVVIDDHRTLPAALGLA